MCAPFVPAPAPSRLERPGDSAPRCTPTKHDLDVSADLWPLAGADGQPLTAVRHVGEIAAAAAVAEIGARIGIWAAPALTTQRVFVILSVPECLCEFATWLDPV